MQRDERNEGHEIILLAEKFSGKTVRPEHWFARDLGLTGHDSIEFIEAIEDRFQIDLCSISPKIASFSSIDVTVQTFIDEVLARIDVPR